MNPAGNPSSNPMGAINPIGASPPPLPVQLPASFIRAAFGPALLMVIGLLFVMEYAGGPRVEQTWPALIITAGLLKLGEFVGARGV